MGEVMVLVMVLMAAVGDAVLVRVVVMVMAGEK